ncbi:hypothetical protein [Streptomyces sp. NPDC060027]|uniref:hypothetical protein n=1 Tax=Streptomyces sp. NPDC060027 TaxID=3347040 RepID=UPI0036A32095
MRWTLISMLAAVTRTPAGPVRLVVASARELIRLLRATVLPRPHRDLAHLLHWFAWRRHHQHQAAQAHRRWNNITAAATT